MLSFDYNRTSKVFADVNVGGKNSYCNIPLISDKYIIMILMLKLKFMQEFTSAINVERLNIQEQ